MPTLISRREQNTQGSALIIGGNKHGMESENTENAPLGDIGPTLPMSESIINRMESSTYLSALSVDYGSKE
jgi:hypothetical protein